MKYTLKGMLPAELKDLRIVRQPAILPLARLEIFRKLGVGRSRVLCYTYKNSVRRRQR